MKSFLNCVLLLLTFSQILSAADGEPLSPLSVNVAVARCTLTSLKVDAPIGELVTRVLEDVALEPTKDPKKAALLVDVRYDFPKIRGPRSGERIDRITCRWTIWDNKSGRLMAMADTIQSVVEFDPRTVTEWLDASKNVGERFPFILDVTDGGVRFKELLEDNRRNEAIAVLYSYVCDSKPGKCPVFIDLVPKSPPEGNRELDFFQYQLLETIDNCDGCVMRAGTQAALLCEYKWQVKENGSTYLGGGTTARGYDVESAIRFVSRGGAAAPWTITATGRTPSQVTGKSTNGIGRLDTLSPAIEEWTTEFGEDAEKIREFMVPFRGLGAKGR